MSSAVVSSLSMIPLVEGEELGSRSFQGQTRDRADDGIEMTRERSASRWSLITFFRSKTTTVPRDRLGGPVEEPGEGTVLAPDCHRWQNGAAIIAQEGCTDMPQEDRLLQVPEVGAAKRPFEDNRSSPESR